MRDELDTFYEDADFADLFQPADNLPFRRGNYSDVVCQKAFRLHQAAEAFRCRIDWKYALSLEFEDSGRDY